MKFSDGQKRNGLVPLLFISHYVELCANDTLLFTAHTLNSLPTVMCNLYVYTLLDIVTAYRSRLHKNKALKGLF